MLKYLVTVTSDLLIVTVLISLLLSLSHLAYGRKGVIVQTIGISVGLLASAVMAIVKNKTRVIATNQWNFYIFLFTILLTLFFLIFSLIYGRRQIKTTVLGTVIEDELGFGGWALCIIAGMLSAIILFYEVPDVMAYPFLFDTAGNGVFSSNYAIRLAGWCTALILLWIYGLYLYRCTISFGVRGFVLTILDVALLINAFRCFGLAVSKWVVKSRWLRWLPTYSSKSAPWAFPVSKFVTNNSAWFSFLIAGIALLIPLLLFIRNIRIHGEWNNAAQKRKLIFHARQKRRWSVVVLVCFAISVFILTFVYAYINRAVTLSEPEEYDIVNDNVCINLTDVNDGKLHRFEYITEKKVEVRWIIVQKPGGSYGVGLDACDVCGTAGYYQRGDEIVCKRCDVVMNINTIGFKGGCNPIPIEYSVENGQIVIPMRAVLAAEKEFKK